MICIKGRFVTYGEVSFDEEPPAGSGVDIMIHRNRKAPIDDAHCVPNLSLVHDLDVDADAIAGRFDKDCRYKVRRADTKDQLTMEVITDPESRLDEFCAFYDAFAQQKALPPASREWLIAACEARELVLTVASHDGEALVWHSYVTAGHTGRLEHSSSCYRDKNAEFQNLVSRANRWLHWLDMLRLKDLGMKRYDWGGMFEDESTPTHAGINKFKRGFGGERERTYTCTVPVSMKGRIWLPLRQAWRSRKSPSAGRDTSTPAADERVPVPSPGERQDAKLPA